jgi:O-antigen biosynthesis protein
MYESVKISILMPVYKVPLRFLTKAIESVQYQTYSNWELCIVDDGSSDVELADYLSEVACGDSRIKLEIAPNNRGIAGATNAAISLATGDFLALLDNDDMLTNDALQCVASEIQSHPDVDFIYSDECTIDEHDNPVALFTKPDWSPCALLNCMYTAHLSVYRKAIVEQVGGMRSAYDFSQDYDLALRVSEITSNVRHIARVLYGWRMIAGSAAQGDKPYARTTNIAALQDAANRRGIFGEAVAEPAANHLRVLPRSMLQKVSIVIPSDNLKNIVSTIDSIVANTLYTNYEIIVVTNSALIKQLTLNGVQSNVILAPFDRAFNFSAKCNVGADGASGEIIVFYNDDVRVVSKDWIEMILECFVHPGVGIVGPKLVYENYLIQHAGMVTGVRGLVGTAFHCLPHATNKHFGAAQWMREVSLICGACLAIKADVFALADGFDAENAPISHSDVDLCFRVREAGYTCSYTPHATLVHIGHMSIGETEKEEALHAVVRKQDKSDIFLLRQWGNYVSYDPYYPPAMRDILYHDSPDMWQLHADVPPAPAGGKDILLVSHDLSGSGAPRIVFEMARVLREAGHFVVVASPSDGIFREKLNALGVPVIIDDLLLRQHSSLEKFAKNFDLVIANTVVTWPVVKLLGAVVKTFWYIHEISLLQHLLNIQPEIKDVFALARSVWVGSGHAAALVLPYRPDAAILKYGVEPLRDIENKSTARTLPLKVALFGSYEPRKGQDLAIAAFTELSPEYRSKLRLTLFGRVLDENLYQMVEVAARDIDEIAIQTEISYERYTEELLACDAVLVSSRDDTLPFVSIDALGAGKVLMCTSSTGTSSYIQHGVSGFISTSFEPHAIAAMLREVVDRAAELPHIARNGKKVFNTEFSVSAFTGALLNACEIRSGKPALRVINATV